MAQTRMFAPFFICGIFTLHNMYCANPQCTGNEPQNARLVELSDQNLTADTDRTLYANAAEAEGKKCAYLCISSYVYSNGQCVEPTYSCQGALPDNATPNNATVPTSNTAYTYSTNTSEVCTFQCETNYTWNSVSKTCVANTQEKDCTGLPLNAKWVNGKFIQTWSGSEWTPTTKEATYNPSSSVECSFKCKDEYNYIDGQCVEEDPGEAPEGRDWACYGYCAPNDNTDFLDCIKEVSRFPFDDNCQEYILGGVDCSRNNRTNCNENNNCTWVQFSQPICTTEDIANMLNNWTFVGGMLEADDISNCSYESEDEEGPSCPCSGKRYPTC